VPGTRYPSLLSQHKTCCNIVLKLKVKIFKTMNLKKYHYEMLIIHYH